MKKLSEIYIAWAEYNGYKRVETLLSYELPYPWEKGVYDEPLYDLYTNENIIQNCIEQMRDL